MNIKRFKITEVIFFLIIWKSLFWSFILVIWNKQIINAYLTCSFSTYTSKLFYFFFCSFNLICIMHHSLICTNNDESFHLSSATRDSVGVGVIVVLYGWERLFVIISWSRIFKTKPLGWLLSFSNWNSYFLPPVMCSTECDFKTPGS